MITYRQLKQMIDLMDENQLDKEIIVVNLDDQDMYYPIHFVRNWTDHAEKPEVVGLDFLMDTLDIDHPFLTFSYAKEEINDATQRT